MMNKTIFKLALKNLFSHKTKTLIIMILIGLGSFLVVIGLGVLNFAEQQTKSVCESDFCGDIFITGKPSEKGIHVTFIGAIKENSTGKLPAMPYLPKIDKITAKLDTLPETARYTRGIIPSYGMMRPADISDSWEPKGENYVYMPYSVTIGVEPSSYKKTFDTVKLYEGEFPDSDDTEFILIPQKVKEKYEKYYDRALHIGDEVVVMCFGEKAKLRKVTVKGFFTFAHPDTAIQTVVYTDINSARMLAGVTMGARTVTEIPKSIDLSLSEKSEDDLFSDDDVGITEEAESITEKKATAADLENILGNTELRNQLNMADTDAWHFAAVKLKDASKTRQTIAALNKWFDEEGLVAQALPWDEAMLQYAGAIKTTQVLMIAVLALLAVVVLIVIMNTLVVSIMERTAEIGTMRAIGAKRSFVRRLFYTESFLLSFIGAVCGIALAVIVGLTFNALGIRFSNDTIAIMFGGYKIQTAISVGAVLSTLGAMIAAGVVANWYPVGLALKISPLEAINK